MSLQYVILLDGTVYLFLFQLARGVIALVSRLFDKTDYSEAGITEVEQLNSYITLKYIHEQLTTFYK